MGEIGQFKREGRTLYGIDFVEGSAYSMRMSDTSQYHAAYRSCDFVGSAEECLAKITEEGIEVGNIYGPMLEELGHL
jgi:hypothetical protein